MSRIRSGPRSSATGRDRWTPRVRHLDGAALAQVAPELAEQQRRAARQLAERRSELRAASASAEARMNALTSASREPAERKPRHPIEA